MLFGYYIAFTHQIKSYPNSETGGKCSKQERKQLTDFKKGFFLTSGFCFMTKRFADYYQFSIKTTNYVCTFTKMIIVFLTKLSIKWNKDNSQGLNNIFEPVK